MLYHSLFFGRQPCTQFEVTSSSEFLKFTDVLDFFFISHPPLGQKEGREHQRIMFYYPETEMMDKKTDVTGFAEAVVNFTGNFIEPSSSLPSTSEYDYRYVNSTNASEIVLIVEDGKFLIGACLNRKLCKVEAFVIHLATIKTHLIKIYETFRLFFGPLTSLFDRVGVVEFKKYLNRFFVPHLTLSKLSKIPLVELFSGVDFMPLGNVDYLEVECLVSRCSAEFPDEVAHTLFLYRDKLIQYSVEKADLIALNQFLTQSLIPFSLQAALQPEVASRAGRSEKHTGHFITGIQDFLGTLSASGFPIVYLCEGESSSSSSSTNYRPFELIAYHALNATICIFVPLDPDANSRKTFLSALAEFLDARLSALASRIGDAVGALPKVTATDAPYNFIYYNPDSLSVRSSFSASISFAQMQGNAGVPPNSIHKLIYETYDHFASDPKNFAQIYMKADNDWWIVFKKVNRRILLLFIPLNPQATITDVYASTDAIVKTHFSHIFVS